MRTIGDPVLVAGTGGFIDGHLVRRLLEEGQSVRAVDAKPLDEGHLSFPEAENLQRDPTLREACFEVTDGVRVVYIHAVDMAGVAFIENNKVAYVFLVFINPHLITAKEVGVDRIFFSSSACVYAEEVDNHPPTSSRLMKRTPARQYPRTVLAGKSSSEDGCTDTLAQTPALRPESLATTKCLWIPRAPTTKTVRRLRLPRDRALG